MNELIMPHNIGVKNALENMKEILAPAISVSLYLPIGCWGLYG